MLNEKSEVNALIDDGIIRGLTVEYNDTSSVKIKGGFTKVDGQFYYLSQDITYSLESLASGVDFHYIYQKISASSIYSPVFRDTTDEPEFSITRNGWHNNNDPLIGLVLSPAGSAVIEFFEVVKMSERLIRYVTPGRTYIIAQNQNPNGSWQTPNVAESSVYLPVNAKEANIYMYGSDAASNYYIAWVSAESAVIKTSYYDTTTGLLGYSNGTFNLWGPLGSSRNIKIAGEDNDDNFMGARVMGAGYER